MYKTGRLLPKLINSASTASLNIIVASVPVLVKMPHSIANIAVGASLNALKAFNIPYVQPLIDVALHIYNTADVSRR